MNTITGVRAFEALDSRGRPTVAARVHLSSGHSARAVVPSGASTGSHEAAERRDGGSRYGGFGVREAVAAANGPLAEAVRGLNVEDQDHLDHVLEVTDGTADLHRFGANAVLAISLAAYLANAEQRHEVLWRCIGPSGPPLLPMPMVNILSGGAHAAGLIDIQDVLVMPVGARTFAAAIEYCWRVRSATAELLRESGDGAALVADEGGLASRLRTNEAGISLVCDGISRAGLKPGQEVCIAIDVAASEIWNGEAYELASEGRVFGTVDWLDEVRGWCRRYPIVSIEDPLAEDDWDSWHSLTSQIGARCQVLGDDLFATNQARVDRGIHALAANAVLVKLNQAGTVSRARRVMTAAQSAGLGTVISARSGDTEDSWLADLAVGWRSGQIKVGSTTRSERTAKWNRLLEIEAQAGPAAEWAGNSFSERFSGLIA